MEEEAVDVVEEAAAEEEGDEVAAVVVEVAEEDAITVVITAGVEHTAGTITKTANQRIILSHSSLRIILCSI